MQGEKVGTRTMMTPADRVKCAMRVFRLSPVEVRELAGASVSSLDGGDLPDEAIARLAERLELPQEWFRGADPTMDTEMLLLEALVKSGPENLKLRGRAHPSHDPS